jgi:hypothetical protein
MAQDLVQVVDHAAVSLCLVEDDSVAHRSPLK